MIPLSELHNLALKNARQGFPLSSVLPFTVSKIQRIPSGECRAFARRKKPDLMHLPLAKANATLHLHIVKCSCKRLFVSLCGNDVMDSVKCRSQ